LQNWHGKLVTSFFYFYYMAIFLKGFLIAMGLIAAIGAQNLHVLKQGLLGRYAFTVAMVCCICDWILITLGVMGVGRTISQMPIASIVLALVGALFLAWYSFLAVQKVMKGSSKLEADEAEQGIPPSLKATLGLTLALTLLNPHVYLDTVVLLGSVAASVPAHLQMYFLLGATSASLVWFLSLALAAKLLRPVFVKPIAWQILDSITAVVMAWISISLLMFAYELIQAL
jgi:L-lysine exporter family protein LysE/ArgO